MRKQKEILGIIVFIVSLGNLLLTNCTQSKSQAQVRLSSNSSNTETNKLESVEKKPSMTNVSSTEQENELETFCHQIPVKKSCRMMKSCCVIRS